MEAATKASLLVIIGMAVVSIPGILARQIYQLYYYAYVPLYRMMHQKMWHFTFVHIFAIYWLIFKIFLLVHYADNLQ